ncbi:helix-turn-helix transcriptional regulator [Thioalbus denitrificans]|uniref:Shikimate kinase n=1 Tax=Thioalbus denitrificans TaxID=547122 RepID=A0A369CDI8_9GAMM|nr:helix-turn-helix transcriptional regulator [Thioalbus denitrificans]RCX31763.1 XRE family transcriptional regulator [Thioalbus denitrificans]
MNSEVNRRTEDGTAVKIYLAALGERVRALRARRGMTRRSLASHSGISERYIAQLESGEANASVALLWRVAEAFGITFAELLQAPDNAGALLPELERFLRTLDRERQAEALQLLRVRYAGHPPGAHGVALIGLRGAGKSTLGVRLAERLGVPFVRLGGLIEELGGMPVGELFSLRGQSGYRRLERQALELAIDRHPRAVVEAGGSLVSERVTYDRLLEAYRVVWIRAEPDDHYRRVLQQGDLRPLQESREAIEDMRRILAEREPLYAAAHRQLMTSGKPVEACVAELAAFAEHGLGGAV